MRFFNDSLKQRAAQCQEPPLSGMLKGRDPWSLDFPLFLWSPDDVFTLRNAVESVAIFGELGAAKMQVNAVTQPDDSADKRRK